MKVIFDGGEKSRSGAFSGCYLSTSAVGFISGGVPPTANNKGIDPLQGKFRMNEDRE